MIPPKVRTRRVNVPAPRPKTPLIDPMGAKGPVSSVTANRGLAHYDGLRLLQSQESMGAKRVSRTAVSSRPRSRPTPKFKEATDWKMAQAKTMDTMMGLTEREIRLEATRARIAGKTLPHAAKTEVAIRGRLDKFLKKYGFKPNATDWDLADAQKFVVKPMGKTLGAYSTDGQITLSPKSAKAAREFMAGKRTPGAINGMSSLVHEGIHSTMPFAESYEGIGMITEEVATEIGARGIMSRAYGVDWRNFTGYQKWIDGAIRHTNEAVQSITKVPFVEDEIFDIMFKASRSMAGSATKVARAIVDPIDAAELYAKHVTTEFVAAAKIKGVAVSAAEAKTFTRKFLMRVDKWIE